MPEANVTSQIAPSENEPSGNDQSKEPCKNDPIENEPSGNESSGNEPSENEPIKKDPIENDPNENEPNENKPNGNDPIENEQNVKVLDNHLDKNLTAPHLSDVSLLSTSITNECPVNKGEHCTENVVVAQPSEISLEDGELYEDSIISGIIETPNSLGVHDDTKPYALFEESMDRVNMDESQSRNDTVDPQLDENISGKLNTFEMYNDLGVEPCKDLLGSSSQISVKPVQQVQPLLGSFNAQSNSQPLRYNPEQAMQFIRTASQSQSLPPPNQPYPRPFVSSKGGPGKRSFEYTERTSANSNDREDPMLEFEKSLKLYHDNNRKPPQLIIDNNRLLCSSLIFKLIISVNMLIVLLL